MTNIPRVFNSLIDALEVSNVLNDAQDGNTYRTRWLYQGEKPMAIIEVYDVSGKYVRAY